MAIRKLLAILLFACTSVLSVSAQAATSNVTPLEVGLFPPLQLPGSDFGVKGLRLTVFGINREVAGIDLGVIGNMTDVTFKGLALSGLFNFNRGNSSVIGLQLAGLANINPGNNSVYGVQIAGYNQAGTVYGFQFGLINVANELHGIQIGLFNINRKGPFRASPIINAAF